MRNTLILVATLLVVLGGVYLLTTSFYAEPTTNTPTTTPEGSNSTSTPNPPRISQVSIALLDTTGSGTGKARGCDTVVLVSQNIPGTTTPLTAAMQVLFAQPEGTQPSAAYNFIARTKSTLKFERAEVRDSTAHIYLIGSLSGLSGVCDDPRAQIQIEETALQFGTVKTVQIYLNNQPTTLTPSQRGE